MVVVARFEASPWDLEPRSLLVLRAGDANVGLACRAVVNPPPIGALPIRRGAPQSRVSDEWASTF